MLTFLAVLLSFSCLASAAEVSKGVAARNVSTVSFLSESMGEERRVNVLLPSDYETSTRRYPVLYLLHGLGDDQTAWSLMSNVSGYAAQYPLIVVMPDASRSFYVNSAADPKARFEDYIAKDLIAYVDSHYRTIPLKRSRAVAGLSMGGYGAMLFGFKHYRKFSAAGSFSGAVAIAHDAPVRPNETEAGRRSREEIQKLFGAKGTAERAERDPVMLVEKVPATEMPLLYISCGAQDFLVFQNRAFVDLLAKKRIAYEYREISPRLHTWDLWDDQLKVFLGILAETPGFGR